MGKEKRSLYIRIYYREIQNEAVEGRRSRNMASQRRNTGKHLSSLSALSAAAAAAAAAAPTAAMHFPWTTRKTPDCHCSDGRRLVPALPK